MTTITAMTNRFKLVKVEELAAQAMEQASEEIVQLNREQMLAGKDKNDKDIEPPYSFATVAIKREKGQEADFVTLKDTGSFQAAMKLLIKGNSFDIVSTDSKSAKLTGKYGQDIFGLTPVNKQIAWDYYLRKLVIQDIKDMTGVQ